jgi:hypothetical protein
MSLAAASGCGDDADTTADVSGQLEGPAFMDELEWISFSTESPAVVVVTTSSEPAKTCIYDIDDALAMEVVVAPRTVTELDSDGFPERFQAFALDECPSNNPSTGGFVVDRTRSDSDQVVLVRRADEVDGFLLTSADVNPVGSVMNLSELDFSVCFGEASASFDSGRVLGFGADWSAPMESWIVPTTATDGCATHTRWLDAGPTFSFFSELGDIAHGEIRLLVFFDSDS